MVEAATSTVATRRAPAAMAEPVTSTEAPSRATTGSGEGSATSAAVDEGPVGSVSEACRESGQRGRLRWVFTACSWRVIRWCRSAKASASSSDSASALVAASAGSAAVSARFGFSTCSPPAFRVPPSPGDHCPRVGRVKRSPGRRGMLEACRARWGTRSRRCTAGWGWPALRRPRPGCPGGSGCGSTAGCWPCWPPTPRWGSCRPSPESRRRRCPRSTGCWPSPAGTPPCSRPVTRCPKGWCGRRTASWPCDGSGSRPRPTRESPKATSSTSCSPGTRSPAWSPRSSPPSTGCRRCGGFCWSRAGRRSPPRG